ncbi:helix-turn-helix transcriptional regulator [Kineococcus glutinatus]|uniref:HTH cro/C1-type domain-containing protein n=1 Tax=Kineococcus glutinatus TaxID=1070872 RepID=A0ABP9HXF6_9ACTN
MGAQQPWEAPSGALGPFIRAQRNLADLSLRELAVMTKVSNAYLSQVERGLHQPSVRVLGAIATALNVPFEQLLEQSGLRPPSGAATREHPATAAATAPPDPPPGNPAPGVEEAVRADPALTEEQRQALLGVYRSFLAQNP